MTSTPSTHWLICAQVADHIGKLKAIAGFLQILASIPMVFGDTLILPYIYAHGDEPLLTAATAADPAAANRLSLLPEWLRVAA